MSRQLLTIAIAMLSLFGAATAAPVVGQKAPDFSGQTADGGTIRLSDFAGRKVVLEWTNNECPFVRKHYGSGSMQALQKTSTSDGTVWITIISSAPGEQGFVDAAGANQIKKNEKAAPTYIVLDPSGEIGRLYRAKTTPPMLVIDGAQTLQYAGAIDSIPSANRSDISRADNYVSAVLASLRAGEPVVVKQRQPYGCAVKYKP